MNSPDITVTDEGDRFQIAVGGRAVGFTQYRDRDGQRTFPHTEVDDAFRGRGLASILIGLALDTTRAAGLTVLPLCPAVQRFIAKHPTYVDLVPTDLHPRFGLD